MLAAYTRLHSAVENRLLPHGDRRNLHLGTVPPHRAAPLEPMTPPIAHCTAFAVRCFRTSALRACLSLSLAFLVFLHGSSSTFAANVGGTWKSVAVSGAQCLVTAVITHPSGLVCIRTDVGGAYRWDRPTSTWVPLTDFLSFDDREYFQCESLAIDPANANVIYYAGGRQKGQWLPGAIFKSTNGGTSWSQLGLSNIPMGGGADRRWSGERLAVDPGNSSVVLFGSRNQGLWRSADGGATWAKIASIPTAGDTYGVQAVAFDPAKNGIVYATVSGSGVYKSSDHGATFSAIGGNTSPRRLQMAPSGSTLWYTHGSGVSKYSGGAWTNYTPGGAAVYCGLAINPSNASDILVGTPEPFGGNEKIYRSTNGGSSWALLTNSFSSTSPWFSNWGSMWTSSLAFDPLNTSTVWCQIWRTTNINASTVAWVQQEVGHEEDVVATLITPPSGTYEVLTGSWDDDGFAFASGNLGVCPAHNLGISGSWNGNTWGMAYQRTNPQNMLRIGAQGYDGGTGLNVARSTNGGATWTRLSNFSTNHFPGVCAVSATNGNNMVIICSHVYSSDPTGHSWPSSLTDSSPWQYTTDGGTTWHTSTGLPTPVSYVGQSPFLLNLAADGLNGSKFYYYDNTTTPTVYASTNGGQSFSAVSQSGLPGGWSSWWQLKARPDFTGDLWLSVDRDSANYLNGARDSTVEGLYHSTDGGVHWSKLANIDRAWIFGFGMPVNNGGPAAIYLYGRTAGETVDTIYESPDLGQSWVQIQAPTNLLGNLPYVIEGSWQTPGRVFVGTSGRGVQYGAGVISWYEAETLAVAAQTSGITYRLSSDGRFSNDTGAYFDATAAGQFVTFSVPNIAAATYDVRVGVKNWSNRGQWQLAISRLDQQGSPTNVGPVIDEYNANEVFTEVDLGTWSPATTSDKAFRFTVAGKNASSTAYGLAFDYIHLIPQ